MSYKTTVNKLGEPYATKIKGIMGNRRKVYIVPTTSLCLSGTTWSEGSLNSYIPLGDIKLPKHSEVPGQVYFLGQPKYQPTYEMKRGDVVVNDAIFRGKCLTTVYVHPDTLKKVYPYA